MPSIIMMLPYLDNRRVRIAAAQIAAAAARGNWEKVVQMYRDVPDIRGERVMSKSKTVLHVAVSDWQEEIVEKLVEALGDGPHDTATATAVLLVADEEGNTPLHLAAAAIGSVRICRCIASVNPAALIGCRNHYGETPFFLAAFHGMNHAFLCFQSILDIEIGYSLCRGTDGDTILHRAVMAENFDLACKIIKRYPKLIYWVTVQGLTPLQILASKPSAFRSGSPITGFFENIVYNVACVKAEELEARNDRPYCSNFAWVKKKLLDMRSSKGTVWNTIKLKQKHVWSVRVLEEFLKLTSMYGYESNGGKPQYSSLIQGFVYDDEGDNSGGGGSDGGGSGGGGGGSDGGGGSGGLMPPTTLRYPNDASNANDNVSIEEERSMLRETNKDTPILIAARNGVVEMVQQIMHAFPTAFRDVDSDNKNIVLLAAENRQPNLYRQLLLMREKNILNDAVFLKTDKDGNSALHLAAKLQEYQPWLVPMPGSALQMQWEIKWYEYVRETMPKRFTIQSNKEGKSGQEIFTATHKELVKSGGEWLTKVSESCSAVAGLIATVAFATSSAVPGGVRSDGTPNLQNEPAFYIFAMASLIALCSSITALAMFLTIRASAFRESDFRTNLPLKMLVGLTSLALSAISVSISFCAGHFFIIKQKLKYAALPVYAVTIAVVLVVILSTTRFTVYFYLFRASWRTKL